MIRPSLRPCRYLRRLRVLWISPRRCGSAPAGHHRQPQEDPAPDAGARPAAQNAAPLHRHDRQRSRWPHLPKPGGGTAPTGPDQLWVADITYVPVQAGFIYVAVVLDAWSRRVVGYAISRSIDARLTVAALTRAIEQRRPAGCVHHSDRGSQGGFNRSSQHPEGGGCDEHSKAAVGSVWAGAVTVTGSTASCRTR